MQHDHLSYQAASGIAKDSVKLPAHEPPISGVVVSSNGEVWLRREEVGRTEVEHLVLSAEGRIKARVTVPQAVTIRRVLGDYAYGVRYDALEIPYVIRFKVERITSENQEHGAGKPPRSERQAG